MVTILYYLEDHCLTIYEPSVINSGM